MCWGGRARVFTSSSWDLRGGVTEPRGWREGPGEALGGTPGGVLGSCHFCSRLMRASMSAKLSSTMTRLSFIVFCTCGGRCGRGDGGQVRSPGWGEWGARGTHLGQEHGVVLESPRDLLLRRVQVYQHLPELGGCRGTRLSAGVGRPPLPRRPRAPPGLTLLVQVPQGHQALHHVGQGTGHGVPALQRLVQLVDLGGSSWGVRAAWGAQHSPEGLFWIPPWPLGPTARTLL